jgi:hypothetical protein
MKILEDVPPAGGHDADALRKKAAEDRVASDSKILSHSAIMRLLAEQETKKAAATETK